MKGVKHYLKDGKEWKGDTHKMKDGTVHTGKTHTKTSKPLFHMKELSKTVQKKIKGFNEGGLTKTTTNQTGLKKLPTAVRNKMGYMAKGGAVKKK